MKKLAALALVATTVSVYSVSAMASGDVDCGATVKSEWMSKEDMAAKVVGMGYEVRKVKEEHGCYEVYARDAEGEKFELFLNPVTGELVEAKKD